MPTFVLTAHVLLHFKCSLLRFLFDSELLNDSALYTQHPISECNRNVHRKSSFEVWMWPTGRQPWAEEWACGRASRPGLCCPSQALKAGPREWVGVWGEAGPWLKPRSFSGLKQELLGVWLWAFVHSHYCAWPWIESLERGDGVGGGTQERQ